MVKSLLHKFTAFMAAVAVLAHDKLFGLMARQGLVMGANTLTGLIPSLYMGLDQVSREFVGFIPGVARDAGVARAAIGQSINSFITPMATAADITPGVTAPNDGDQVLSNIQLAISKARYVPIRWNGEEQLGLNNGGPGHRPILLDQITQAFRSLANEMETDLALAAYRAASRAAGTPGTTPFGVPNDLSDFALTAQILDDNGTPPGRTMVVNSASMANLRGKQSVLFKTNEAGTDELLRRGRVGMVTDFGIGYSGLITPHVKGTGAGYVTSGTYAVGATAITLATGTGTVKAGDVVTFVGDTNKYVVAAGVSAPGVITLNRPGLRMPLASGVAMTIGNSFTPNVAFARNGLLLATRLPALPTDLNGNAADMADDRTTVQDPFSGITFEVSLYRQYRQIRIEIAAVWGVAAPNPSQIALLLG
jgi:hypothetical protein